VEKCESGFADSARNVKERIGNLYQFHYLLCINRKGSAGASLPNGDQCTVIL